MVVQPLAVAFPADPSGPQSAWTAVETRQRCTAHSYLLVSQPDHAQLSGEVAAHFVSPHFPRLSREAIEAIAVHDSGWKRFPGETEGEPALTLTGKPRSFIEFEPDQFVQAWRGSIEHAAELSSLGGMLVSRHFSALARFAISRLQGEAKTDVLTGFLAAEEHRHAVLSRDCRCSPGEVEEGLAALQFCDLLSLALCCEIREEVEFLQSPGAAKIAANIKMRFADGVYQFTPSPFQAHTGEPRDITLRVPARKFPSGTRSELHFVVR